MVTKSILNLILEFTKILR